MQTTRLRGVLGAAIAIVALGALSATASAATCTDYFRGTGEEGKQNQWAEPKNWSLEAMPGVGDYACIPSGALQQVSFNLGVPPESRSIAGVNDESSKGLNLYGNKLTLTDPEAPSAIENLQAGGDGSIQVDSLDALTLDGTSTHLGAGRAELFGPGTITTTKGQTTTLGHELAFWGGLQFRNERGTLELAEEGGVGLSAEPASSIINSGKITMKTGYTVNAGQHPNESLGPNVTNTAKGTIYVSHKLWFQGEARFINEGSVKISNGATLTTLPIIGNGTISIGTGLLEVDGGEYEVQSGATVELEIKVTPANKKHATEIQAGRIVDKGGATLAGTLKVKTKSSRPIPKGTKVYILNDHEGNHINGAFKFEKPDGQCISRDPAGYGWVPEYNTPPGPNHEPSYSTSMTLTVEENVSGCG